MRPFRHWTGRYLFDRSSLLLYERRNPDAPWITAAMTRILDSWLRPSDVGLEFGSGRSTAWFAARVAHLTSVEHDPAWHSRVTARLARAGLDERVRYVLRPVADGTVGASDYVGIADEIPRGGLDFCLVDGVARDQCALRALDRLRAGGALLLDDANWYMPRESPSRAPNSRRMRQGCASELWSEFLERTRNWRVIWTTNGVTDTAMFLKPP